jgi:hypothetical protein
VDGKKTAIVAGLAALAVIAWLVLRGGHDQPAQTSRAQTADDSASTGAPVPAEPGGAPASGGERTHPPVRAPIHVPSSGDPTTPTPDAAPPAHPALANGFDAESRDDGWADDHEREIGRRLAKVHVDGVALDKVECKSDQCRIAFTAADDHALGTYLHKLESADALQGYAQMMVMEGITDTDDGKRQERVYARFAE